MTRSYVGYNDRVIMTIQEPTSGVAGPRTRSIFYGTFFSVGL